jgi:hypothetical protein
LLPNGDDLSVDSHVLEIGASQFVVIDLVSALLDQVVGSIQYLARPRILVGA